MKWVLFGSPILAIGLGLITYNHHPFSGGDNYAYILLAKSLRQGRYVELWTPGEPQHRHFPPGYPLILAPFTTTVEGAKRVSFACWIGFVFLWWWWLRKRLKLPELCAVMLITVCSPPLLKYASLELSEMPFLFFTMLAIVLYEKNMVVGMLMSIICMFIRPTGVALVLAMGGWAVYKKQWWALGATIAILALLPLLPRSEWKMVNPYRPELGMVGLWDMPGRVLSNLAGYGKILLGLLKCW